MELELIKVEKERLRFRIKGASYTLGTILQKVLLEDDRIMGAGFYRPYPLKNEIIFDIYFNEDVDKDNYKNIIIENIEKLKNYLNVLKKSIFEELDKVSK